jgi:hypothetical protein
MRASVNGLNMYYEVHAGADVDAGGRIVGVVRLDIATSLDGFVAGPNDRVGQGLGERGAERSHDWFFKGTTVSRHNEWFKTSGHSTEVLDEAFETDRRVIGAPGATHLRYRVVKR